jgi:fructokinase
MRKIYTIGETVLDIIFKNQKPQKAIAGGSMLNTAVSLGRLKEPVYFITESGKDLSGKIIKDFLIENDVNTDYIYEYDHGNTTLALAFLDENNNAEYNFYKNYPSERFNITFPVMNKNDILLFGSFLAIDRGVRSKIVKFLLKAKEKGVIIVYDPNFRKPHLHELPSILPFIKENISFSDIVKGSDEDFQLIFNSCDTEELYNIIKCKNLIITGGAKDVKVKTEDFTKTYSVDKINIKSTIGAGDNFNSGILYSLSLYNIDKDNINSMDITTWDKIIKNSITFACHVCGSYDNYIDREFAEKKPGFSG